MWDCLFGLPFIEDNETSKEVNTAYAMVFICWLICIPILFVDFMLKVRAKRIDRIIQNKRIRVQFEEAAKVELHLLDEELANERAPKRKASWR